MTLIELILVMAMLATVLGIAAPRLARFYQGRGLTEETRRVLALTRFARNLAVNTGVPMILWFHPEDNTFGLRPQSGFENEETQSLNLELSERFKFEFEEEAVDEEGQAEIVFWPDGSIDAESIEQVSIRHVDDETELMLIVQMEYRMGYEVGDLEEQA